MRDRDRETLKHAAQVKNGPWECTGSWAFGTGRRKIAGQNFLFIGYLFWRLQICPKDSTARGSVLARAPACHQLPADPSSASCDHSKSRMLPAAQEESQQLMPLSRPAKTSTEAVALLSDPHPVASARKMLLVPKLAADPRRATGVPTRGPGTAEQAVDL